MVSIQMENCEKIIFPPSQTLASPTLAQPLTIFLMKISGNLFFDYFHFIAVVFSLFLLHFPPILPHDIRVFSSLTNRKAKKENF